MCSVNRTTFIVRASIGLVIQIHSNLLQTMVKSTESTIEELRRTREAKRLELAGWSRHVERKKQENANLQRALDMARQAGQGSTGSTNK